MTLDIENDHNVYVLGAGFSYDAGLPLTAELLNTMRDALPWLRSNKRKREAKAVERVLEFRQRAASAAYRVALDLENVEELFSLADSLPESDVSQVISHAIAATLDYARLRSPRSEARVQLHCDGPPDASFSSWVVDKVGDVAARTAYSVPLYDYVVGALLGRFASTRGRNTIVSFNYDLIVENALDNLGLRYQYGFGKQSVNYDPTARGVKPGVPCDVDILKLHGSLNWGYRTGGGRSFTVYKDYEGVFRAKAVPILVPPTWRKAFNDQLGSVWNGAVEALRTATRVVVIGFSFPPTDLHVRYLVAAGLKENVSLREVHVVDRDPTSEEMSKKISAVFGPRTKVNPHNNGLAQLVFRGGVKSIGRPVEAPWFRTDDVPSLIYGPR